MSDSLEASFLDGDVMIEAMATGRKEDRGAVCIVLDDYEAGRVVKWFTTSDARAIAATLSDFADRAERFSTRGFVGSDE